jgi:hypothetical protein
MDAQTIYLELIETDNAIINLNAEKNSLLERHKELISKLGDAVALERHGIKIGDKVLVHWHPRVSPNGRKYRDDWTITITGSTCHSLNDNVMIRGKDERGIVHFLHPGNTEEYSFAIVS